MRTAEAIARRTGALALATGESLGQVASQTLENLAAIESVAGIPVLRPLIGMDKQEIVREAEAIGTFELSIKPHDDCCGFLMPRNPATHSTAEQLSAAEAPFDPLKEVETLLGATEVVELGRGRRRGSWTGPKEASTADGSGSGQSAPNPVGAPEEGT